jgi:predicted ATP-grasp superfamily ATP-dependent carboligase
MTKRALVIIGASVRAAAFSALRAGFEPWCADLFADADLRACAQVRHIAPANYPKDFVRLLEEAQPGPWLFTGGLENHPDLIGKMARYRPLWGNYAYVLRRIRCPFEVAAVLAEHRIPCPAVWRHADQVPADCTALAKPLHSAGGTGIHVFSPREEKYPGRADVYLQEYVPGEPCAAIYLADGQVTCLVGVTRQLVGVEWLQAQPFHYCGSIGPRPLEPSLRQAFERLGSVLTRNFGLRGLFGVDCVVRDQVPWPVEVNPRYAASVEVLEHALGIQTLASYPQVFKPDRSGGHDEQAAPLALHHSPIINYMAKAILFAREPVVFPPDGPWAATLKKLAAGDRVPRELPAFADIPQAGEQIPARRPVLTFFASSSSWNDCEQSLQQIGREVDHWLFGG